MPRRRGVRIAVLVEDEALRSFADKVLRSFGFRRREIRLIPYPVGSNAKQWVTREYPGEVRVYRRQANHQQVTLLVGTDADEQTVQQRHDALAESLRQAALPPREEHERITLWIPKWHIETWILHLAGQEVSEDKSYKHDVRNPDFAATAEKFVEHFRELKKDPNGETLPSLKRAFQETKRLDV